MDEEQLKEIKKKIFKHKGCENPIGLSNDELLNFNFPDIRGYAKLSIGMDLTWITYQIYLTITSKFHPKYWADIFETTIINNSLIEDADKLSIFSMLYERTLRYCNSFKKDTFKQMRCVYQNTYDKRIDEFITDGYLILYRGISSDSAPLEKAHSYSLNRLYASEYQFRGKNGKLIARRIRPDKIIVYIGSKDFLIPTGHVLAFYEDTEPLPPEYTISDPLEGYKNYTESMKKCFQLIGSLGK